MAKFGRMPEQGVSLLRGLDEMAERNRSERGGSGGAFRDSIDAREAMRLREAQRQEARRRDLELQRGMSEANRRRILEETSGPKRLKVEQLFEPSGEGYDG